jgi:hypothetical protein
MKSKFHVLGELRIHELPAHPPGFLRWMLFRLFLALALLLGGRHPFGRSLALLLWRRHLETLQAPETSTFDRRTVAGKNELF